MKRLLGIFLALLGVAVAQPTVPLSGIRIQGTNNQVNSASSLLAASGGTLGISNGGTFTFNTSSLFSGDAAAFRTAIGAGTGAGTVTSIPDGSTNGVVWTVANRTTTPTFTFSLGAITPTSVAASGAISGTTGGFSGTVTVTNASDAKVVATDGTSSISHQVTGALVRTVYGNASTNGLRFDTGSYVETATPFWEIRNGADATRLLKVSATGDGTFLGGVLGTSGTFSSLTSGRVPIVSTAGLLTDDSDLTFATDTLTATKIVGTTSITGGTIAGTTGTFSALTSGRVPFVSTAGLLTDSATLTFTDSSGGLSVSGVYSVGPRITARNTNNTAATTTALLLENYGLGTSSFVTTNIRGTLASPLPNNANDILGRWEGWGYASGGGAQMARIDMALRSTWTESDRESALNFYTTDATTEALTLTLSGAAASTITGGAGNMTITSGSGNSRTLTLQTTTSGGTATDAIVFGDTQKVTKYANISTAGNGLVSIQGAGRVTGQTSASASVATYTVGSSDASFVVSSNVRVTTSSAEAFTVTCAYTDEGNTSRTATLNFQLVSGIIGTSIAAANGAVPYSGIPIHIRCKASTSITMATTGTFTGATYNAEGVITKLQ